MYESLERRRKWNSRAGRIFSFLFPKDDGGVLE
jgi:hypothetical protein